MLILFYFLMPAIVILACQRYSNVGKLGAVIVCYILGSASEFVLQPLMPSNASMLKDQAMTVLLVCAIPLLLMSLDLKRWFSMAGSTLKAMGSAITAVVMAAIAAFFLLSNSIEQPADTLALTTAVYIGGTPNMAAVKEAVQANELLFLEIHAYDSLLSIAYLLFVMLFAQRVFQNFLPGFNLGALQGENTEEIDAAENYQLLLSLDTWQTLWPALSALTIIVGLVTVLASVVAPVQQMAATMILLSLGGIVSSCFVTVRKAPASYELGMYLILVFCIIVGSLIDSSLIHRFNANTMAFVGIVMFGSLFLHAIFCRFLKIDTDTFLITSVATICSPALIPMVAASLKNRTLVLSGIGVGVLGYASGSIIAIGLSATLEKFL